MRRYLAHRKLQPPEPPGPKNDADRAYLLAMYQEHAEHARQHETLRASATGLLTALIGGLLAYASTQGSNKAFVGALICLVSVLGAIVNEKHYERYMLHRDILRGFRASLQIGLSDGLSKINDNFRDWHKLRYPFWSSRVRLHTLWTGTYGITFLIGAALFVGWIGG